MTNIAQKIAAVCCILFFPIISRAQTNSITLDSCYVLAQQNYPLIKQYALIDKSRDYNLKNAATGYLPQINIHGQATYQSDVTTLPIKVPGTDIPRLSKDQYKIYAAINQPVYDGGITKQQKRIQVANANIDRQDISVQLYQIKARINQLFFGILLINEQLKQNELLKKDIQAGLDKTTAAIVNGVALKSSADLLKVELLNAGQQTIKLEANRQAYLDILGMFIHRSLDSTTILTKPQTPVIYQEIKRPELKLFTYKNEILTIRNDLLSAKNHPRISLFGQAGFGRPALNFLSNDFKGYYIGGIQLSVPLTGFYTLKNDRNLIRIHREQIGIQKETFLFNTNFKLKQQTATITKLEKILKSDDEIIPLRTNIKKTALVQLQNGIINTNDYIQDVHAEDNARLNRILHEIQLLMAEYEAKITTGS